MLVLSRKLGESVKVGDQVVVTVVEIRGNNIRLGFDAPREIPITRPDVIATEETSSTRKAA